MIENKFIKLHSNEDNSPIIVNVNEIILICTDTDEDKNKITSIYLDNDTIDAIETNETPERISMAIAETGCTDFVKLHSSDDNAVIVVNTNDIVIINQTEENSKKVSTMYFDNESVASVTFNESPERIYQMIIDSQKTNK